MCSSLKKHSNALQGQALLGPVGKIVGNNQDNAYKKKADNIAAQNAANQKAYQDAKSAYEHIVDKANITDQALAGEQARRAAFGNLLLNVTGSSQYAAPVAPGVIPTPEKKNFLQSSGGGAGVLNPLAVTASSVLNKKNSNAGSPTADTTAPAASTGSSAGGNSGTQINNPFLARMRANKSSLLSGWLANSTNKKL